MRVLVTGAAGFVGAHVTSAVEREGHTPIAATSPRSDPSRLRTLCRPELQRVTLDLEDPESVVRAVKESVPDAVIHTAAYGAVHTQSDASAMVRINVGGAVAVHEACRRAGITRLLHIGTAFEYGPHADAVDEQTPLEPVGAYAASKAAAFLMLRALGRAERPNPVTARLFNLFGPHDSPARLGAQIVDAATQRQPLKLTAGVQRRDFMFVRDAARILAALVVLPDGVYPEGETLNVASGRPMTVREFAQAFADALGAAHLLQFGEISQRSDAPTDLWGRPERLEELLEKAGRSELSTTTEFTLAARLSAQMEN